MVRRRLPKQRPSQTISFQVGDAEGYLTAGQCPGDGLGEIFVKLGKQGSTLSGVMDTIYRLEERNAALDAGYPPAETAASDRPAIDAEGQPRLPVERSAPVDDLSLNPPFSSGVTGAGSKRSAS